jgi:hypothetical protein
MFHHAYLFVHGVYLWLVVGLLYAVKAFFTFGALTPEGAKRLWAYLHYRPMRAQPAKSRLKPPG